MARVGKEVRLQDRAARARLSVGHHPHWRSISEGCHLGYYRGARTTKWVARFRKAGAVVPYEMLTLGETDDRAPANGTTILDWKQALAAATEWFELKERGGTVDPRKLTVRFALDDYIAMRDARESAHAGRTIRSNASQRLKVHIFNDAELIDRPLSKLTEDDLRRWLSRLPPSKITSKKRLASDFKAALNMTFARHRSVLPPDLPITIRYGLQVSTEDAPVETRAREGQILTDAQVRRVIEIAFEQDVSGDLGRVFVLLAATGARFSQIRKMRVQDVQIEHSRVMVPKSRKGRGKGGGHIRVPVGSDVLVTLRPILRDRPGTDLLLERWAWKRVGYNRFERGAREPWTASWQITHSWRSVAIAAGVPDAVAYSLRHSSIVRGLREGLPIRLVAALHDTSVDMIEKHYSAWQYPQGQLIALRRQNQQAEAAQPVSGGIDLARVNFRYEVTGDRAPWRPLRAFDDEKQVFIEFPRGIGQGEMPPLFVVGPEGDTSELVNYRVRGNYMIVDRLFAAAELRFGAGKNQKRVRISRTDGRPAS